EARGAAREPARGPARGPRAAAALSGRHARHHALSRRPLDGRAAAAPEEDRDRLRPERPDRAPLRRRALYGTHDPRRARRRHRPRPAARDPPRGPDRPGAPRIPHRGELPRQERADREPRDDPGALPGDRRIGRGLDTREAAVAARDRVTVAALRSKDLVGIEPLTPDEITLLLDTAESMRSIGQ